jgi:hypothetical protein
MSAAEQSYGGRDRTAASRQIGGLDKFSFFLIFLVGSAGIVSLRTQFGLWQGYVIIWSISWMFVYLALVLLAPRYRLRPDQAGDNLYYLGFLYTLVSLSVALYFFTDAEAALDQIISNFGIALATTILGIALRVVLHQMREDPIDTEREARLNLAEAASRLRAELDVSVREVSSFTRQMQQSIEEALHAVSEQAGKRLEDSGGQVIKAATDAREGIQQALSDQAEHAKEQNAAARRQVQATEKLAERMEAIDVPTDWIDRKIAPALAQIMARVEAELRQIQGRAAETQSAVLQEQMKAVEELRARARGQRDEFDAQLQALRESGARRILESVQALADRQAAAYERIAQQTDANLTALERSRLAMEEEVERARAATRDVVQQLASMVRTLGEELAGTGPARMR